MGTIAATPKGASAIADPYALTIHFPSWDEMVQVDAKVARATGAGRIAPPDMEQRVKALLKHRQTVDLAEGGQLRFGAGVILFDLSREGRPLLGTYDSGHPTRPNHASPPCGLVEDCTPRETAYEEVSQEFILVSSEAVGIWTLGGRRLSDKRAREYAARKGLRFDSRMNVDIREISTECSWNVFFGDEKVNCLIEFEPDTGSMEILLTGEIALPDHVRVVDGERLPDGAWRDQSVVCSNPMTSKAVMAVYVANERSKQKKFA